MSNHISIVPALSTADLRQAAGLVFEYLAATLREGGRPVPDGVFELPPVLRDECTDLATAYRAPGTVLIAYDGVDPVGCVGLQARKPVGTAEIRRLYVQPGCRRLGIGSRLIEHAHRHAAERGLQRLVLDVMPSRIHVIDFYRGLGYTETAPFPTEAPDPMVYLHRPVTPDQGHA